MIRFLTLVVADVMTTDVLSVEPDTPLSKLRGMFEVHEYGALPVLDGEQLVGWITQFDLLRALLCGRGPIMPDYDEVLAQPASSVMTQEPETVSTINTLYRVLHRMIDTRHRSFPVVDAGKLVGIIAREDILRGLDNAEASPALQGNHGETESTHALRNGQSDLTQ